MAILDGSVASLNRMSSDDAASISYQFNEWGLLASQTQTTLAAAGMI
ncbi:hypothetical protein [Rheinheimera sp. MM224]|nr:hypothetical protein [Rheinheimera sp. MM224]